MPNQTPEPDPVQYPRIKIGDEFVRLRFRCGDILRLEAEGLDIFALPQATGTAAVKMFMTLLKHAIAHDRTVSIEELADAVDYADLGEVQTLLTAAIKKASANPMPEAIGAAQ